VAFEVTGAELVAFRRAQCHTDYHVHVALDRDVSAWLGTDVPVLGTDVPASAEQFIKHTPSDTNDEPRNVTFSGVATGQHTAIAWLSFADHTSVKPPISSSITFIVR